MLNFTDFLNDLTPAPFLCKREQVIPARLNRVALIYYSFICSFVSSLGSSIAKTLDTGSDLQGCVFI